MIAIGAVSLTYSPSQTKQLEVASQTTAIDKNMAGIPLANEPGTNSWSSESPLKWCAALHTNVNYQPDLTSVISVHDVFVAMADTENEVDNTIKQLQSEIANQKLIITLLLKELAQSKKAEWGIRPKGRISQDTRNQLIEFVSTWVGRTGISIQQVVSWIEVNKRNFYRWRAGIGMPKRLRSKHTNCRTLEPSEIQLLIDAFDSQPQLGFRRLAYLLNDRGVLAIPVSAVYKALRNAKRLNRRSAVCLGISRRRLPPESTDSPKPSKPHEQWIAVASRVVMQNVFYKWVAFYDRYSEFIVDWEIYRTDKVDPCEIQELFERAKVTVSPNTPCYLTALDAKGLNSDINRLISVYFPTDQHYENVFAPYKAWFDREDLDHKQLYWGASLPDGFESTVRSHLARFVHAYNCLHLNSTLGYVTPLDYVSGRHDEIAKRRKQNICESLKRRKATRSKTVSARARAGGPDGTSVPQYSTENETTRQALPNVGALDQSPRSI